MRPSGAKKTAFLLLVSVMTIGCQARRDSSANERLMPVSLAHWGHEKVFIYLPLYVAIDKGFMEEEGVSVDILYSGNDDQVFASVLSGAADIGAGDPAFTAISREKGGSGKVIAALVERVSNWGVGSPALRGRVLGPADLEGLAISSFPSPSTAYTILEDIKETFKLPTMTIVQLTPGSEIAALERGDIDIALTGEPAASLSESHGYPVVLSLADYYGPFTFSGITTRDAVINERPEALQAVVSGLQRAVEYIRSDLDGTIEVGKANFPALSEDVIKRAVERMVAEESIPVDVVVEPEAWQRTLEMRRATGDLGKVNPSESVDNSFADGAVDRIRREELKEQRRSELLPPVESSGRGMNTATTRDLIGLVADVITLMLAAIALIGFVSWLAYRRELRRLGPGEKKIAYLVLEAFKQKGFTPLSEQDIRHFVEARTNAGEALVSRTLEHLGKRYLQPITREGHVYLIPRPSFLRRGLKLEDALAMPPGGS